MARSSPLSRPLVGWLPARRRHLLDQVRCFNSFHSRKCDFGRKHCQSRPIPLFSTSPRHRSPLPTVLPSFGSPPRHRRILSHSPLQSLSSFFPSPVLRMSVHLLPPFPSLFVSVSSPFSRFFGAQSFASLFRPSIAHSYSLTRGNS